jgi:uncharacterized protein (DUF1697 family)
MPQYVAFLRGINLGNRRLTMSRLGALFEEIGFADVATFIASGNVVFSCRAGDTRKLESRIAKHLESSLGYDVDTFVRTAAEVLAVGKFIEFDDLVRQEGALNIGFFHERLPLAKERKLATVRTDNDQFRVIGREYYWYSRVGVAKSEVWKLPAVKALQLPLSTVRNMNSIRRLVAKHLV